MDATMQNRSKRCHIVGGDGKTHNVNPLPVYVFGRCQPLEFKKIY